MRQRRVKSSRALKALTAVTLFAAAAPVSAAPGTPPPNFTHTRLAGTFALAGTVTAAQDIPGERVGQHVLRIWDFAAPCPAGACSKEVLTRARSNGTDRLTLRRRTPGFYVGSGRFYAPARCASRTYAHGILVPFQITVRLTAVGPDATGASVAARLQATYTNLSRTNLTPCVEALGHDAATYHGHLL